MLKLIASPGARAALLAAKALGAAARALQPFLTSPAVIPVFKAKGLERD